MILFEVTYSESKACRKIRTKRILASDSRQARIRFNRQYATKECKVLRVKRVGT